MDWSKAKTILIIAFLITNILLVSVLISSGRQTDTTIKEEFVEDVIRLLNQKKIYIATEIPKNIPSLNTVSVEYETISSKDINKNFFNGKGILTNKESNIVNIAHEDEYITITNDKRLYYENKAQSRKYTNLNEETVKEISMEFLRERNYDTSDMFLSYIGKRNNKYYLEFSNMYNGIYLETSSTTMEVDNRGVIRLDRVWLNPLEEGEKPIYINTAPKAILSLLSMEEVYGKTIKDISLCYYFEPENHDYLKEPSVAKKGKTIPAWRVLFEDGYKIIIDNY